MILDPDKCTAAVQDIIKATTEYMQHDRTPVDAMGEVIRPIETNVGFYFFVGSGPAEHRDQLSLFKDAA